MSKSNAARIVKRYRNVPRRVLGSEVKGQGHKSQKTLPAWAFACTLLFDFSSF